MENIKKLLENLKPSNVLDIGTGVGEFINILKEALPSYDKITGIDIEEKVIEMAKKTFNEPSINFEVMNGESMEYSDGEFDLVCLANSIHHLPNIKTSFDEMKRVTSENGYILINEMFKDNQTEEQQTHVILHHWSAKISRMLGKFHNETYNKSEIKEILLENNLEIIDEIEFKYDEPCNQEAKEQLSTQVGSILDSVRDKIKDHEAYEEICSTAEDLKKRVLDIGFQGATQYMLLCRKI
ncbi:class I SAM-dependent methyltransferase [Oceanirhabdus sp. W0125-5]|uniref:class I SAM-dependent methyltransferase n=1 Tax=Oceanirhabdus sp. W0125-5 TaxID=2999116 RepID=UPI0022F2FD51|nr:class I SAM-dependent methyltransferase [Oceanirhabdus sp. W0125-5]WBW95742.1 class I SAM-dependent methyltransferase [Oceanirhabdus sp. W0125-5]